MVGDDTGNQVHCCDYEDTGEREEDQEESEAESQKAIDVIVESPTSPKDDGFDSLLGM